MEDLASILLTDEPTAQEKLAALTAHLRRQQAVGQLATLIGGPAKGFGQSLTSGADQELAQVAQVPMDRQRLALQRQQLASGEADAAEKVTERGYRNAPGSAMSTTARALLSKFMPKQAVAPNATAGELLSVLPLAEKGYQVDESARQRALARQLAASRDSAVIDGLSPAALDQMATQYGTTGQLPALGMGKAASAIREKIANRWAEMDPTSNLAQAKAGFGADSGSLRKLQQQADAIGSFERTALANGDVFMQQARSLGIDTGSPLFNAPYRKFSQQVAGDPKMAAFAAARQTFVQEISKILSGSMGNTAVSDSARHEAEGLLSKDASLAQIEAAFNILKTDLANRKEGLAAQLAEIRGRVGGGSKAPSAAPISSTSGGVPPGVDPADWKRLQELEAKAKAGTIQ